MSPAAKKPPGKGLVEKRTRLLRCLHAHVEYLGTVATMAPWAPPERQERPSRPPDPDPYRAMTAARYVFPRSRPELAHACPGPDDMPEDEVKAWVAEDYFVRSGLSAKTQKACAYIASFAPRRLARKLQGAA